MNRESYLQDEDDNDEEGYLRPTFPNTDLAPGRDPPGPPSPPEIVIMPESYECPDTIRDNIPDLVRHPPMGQVSPVPSYNSLPPFERSQPPRTSQASSLASSVRDSPSEPLITSVTTLKPVDV